MSLREKIEELQAHDDPSTFPLAQELFAELKAALNRGEVRAADRDADGIGEQTPGSNGESCWDFVWASSRICLHADHSLFFFDKNTYPLRALVPENNVRIVPGGSSIRDAFVAPNVVCMPPMYVNVGAYVDEGTMIDSHALVGSCAQIGKRVHLSAAAQVGGVLEPVGAMPVIIEDDVLVGGNCGVYEGAIVRAGAVLAPGTILTGATAVYDLVRDRIHRRTNESSLEIPAGAVVVPGSRAVTTEKGREWGLSLYAPVIVKYRDDKTDRSVQLEDYLR